MDNLLENPFGEEASSDDELDDIACEMEDDEAFFEE